MKNPNNTFFSYEEELSHLLERLNSKETCQKCGMPNSWHKKEPYKSIYRCHGRKKPYKTADGVDVKLGMQVWNYFPYDASGKHDVNGQIRSGIVMDIQKWGTIRIFKNKEDRKSFFDNRHEPDPIAYDSCFSSLENAEKFREKKIARNRRNIEIAGI